MSWTKLVWTPAPTVTGGSGVVWACAVAAANSITPPASRKGIGLLISQFLHHCDLIGRDLARVACAAQGNSARATPRADATRRTAIAWKPSAALRSSPNDRFVRVATETTRMSVHPDRSDIDV